LSMQRKEIDQLRQRLADAEGLVLEHIKGMSLWLCQCGGGTCLLCRSRAFLGLELPAAPIPQPAPAPETCKRCRGRGAVLLDRRDVRHWHVPDSHFGPCPTCRPATPGDGRERP
jgi:hypothetical protein